VVLKRSAKARSGSPPSKDRYITLEPKISVGKYRGRTSKEINRLLLLRLRVRLAPIVPMKLKAGVPIIRLEISQGKLDKSRFKPKAINGAIIVNGRPVVIQCASILRAIINSNGKGDRHSISKDPSSKSGKKIRSNAKRTDNNAAIQIIPGAMRERSSLSGPTPKGTKNIIIVKKNKLLMKLPPFRKINAISQPKNLSLDFINKSLSKMDR